MPSPPRCRGRTCRSPRRLCRGDGRFRDRTPRGEGYPALTSSHFSGASRRTSSACATLPVLQPRLEASSFCVSCAFGFSGKEGLSVTDEPSLSAPPLPPSLIFSLPFSSRASFSNRATSKRSPPDRLRRASWLFSIHTLTATQPRNARNMMATYFVPHGDEKPRGKNRYASNIHPVSSAPCT